MIFGNLATLKSNTVIYEYSGGLIIYNKEPLLENKEFILFLNDFFDKYKVSKFARLVVQENESNYEFNADWLKNITSEEDFQHTFENQLLIFKGQRLFAYAPLDEIIQNFNKILKKQ